MLLTNNVDWREPKTAKVEDVAAAERSNQFWLGWFADPLYFGDYPDAMKKLVPNLPVFTSSQSKLLMENQPDFFGLNHYGTGFCEYDKTDTWMYAYCAVTHDGLPNGGSIWLYGSAWGFRKLLNWVHKRYHPFGGIIVTENGWSVHATTPKDGIVDPERVYFYANYTSAMLQAIRQDGVDVRGYFGWSLVDNYEWERGYTERFGVIYNDYGFGMDPNSATNQDSQPTLNQTRYIKDSGCYLMSLWANSSIPDPANFTSCRSNSTTSSTRWHW